MVRKMIVFVFVFLLVAFSVFSVLLHYNLEGGNDMETEKEKPLYQGPVPEGYDEQYFRETGITKPLEVEE